MSSPLIGVLGGTFDPPHLGHLQAARAVQAALAGTNLAEVWWLPAALAPHKDRQPGASQVHRLRMVELMVADEPAMHVCDVEIARGGISYSVESAERLLQLYPDKQFAWIIGADMVQNLPNWFEIKRLSELITFIGLARPGFELDVRALPGFLQERIQIVPMEAADISSTEVRTRLRRGDLVQAQLSAQVLRYIEENGLYED
jgi:nicotinate-nucleotide adenylyltransferase